MFLFGNFHYEVFYIQVESEVLDICHTKSPETKSSDSPSMIFFLWFSNVEISIVLFLSCIKYNLTIRWFFCNIEIIKEATRVEHFFTISIFLYVFAFSLNSIEKPPFCKDQISKLNSLDVPWYFYLTVPHHMLRTYERKQVLKQ